MSITAFRHHGGSRRAAVATALLGLVAAPLALGIGAPAQASVSTKNTVPYSQDWSNPGLITANDDWSGVTGVQGYLGQDITTSTGTDPQTLTGESVVVNDTDVIANSVANLNTLSSGGVVEHEPSQALALQGSGTADAPHLVFRLDLTGKSTVAFDFDVKDLDGSADNATQRIAVQYRIGATGAYTNLPEGYVADATEQNAASKVTAVSVTLPSAANDAADVFVRVITTNAVGNDEWVGIDNIVVDENTGPPPPLEATSPGNKTGMVGQPITEFTLAASGGTTPYTWGATGLPGGVNVSSGGVVSGTPTTEGVFNVEATVTDNASPTPATDSVSFTFTIAEPAVARTIAEIQGTGARSPFAPATGNLSGTETVTTQGVVTARYATGGFNGMYIQTPGADTDGASDGVFVYAGPGNANIPSGVVLGDSVQVTGRVAEFFDLTQVVPTSSSAVTEIASLGTVMPRAIAYPTTAAAREVREGELLAPTDTFTVTNNYSVNQYAEMGLATGTTPLRQPTEYASPNDLDAINAINADNLARAVVLDDAQSTNFMQNQTTKAIPLPWLTPTNPIRVGARATFTGPVVLDWRNGVWKFQPTHPVTDSGADVVTFEDTRAANMVPQDVLGADGDLKIATFNVLNYFNTTGEAYAAAGPLQNPPLDTFCTYYTDRQSNRIGNNSCGVRLVDDPETTTNEANTNDGRGPRGAATAISLARQEEKLANTINALDADVIGLEEVENSIKLPGETNRDDALARIVEILNTDAGEDKWAYVKSPGEALTASAVAEQDVIRGAFIYQRDSVETVGQSDLLLGTTQFANAREPLAQAFKAKGAPHSDAFAVIVNHFKSKGDNADPAPPATGDNAADDVTGIGAFNGDRVRQAGRLVQFANDFAAERDIAAVFLAGDFNAYTMEEPITVLEDGGYALVESDDPNDESYSYQGRSGSLDHVLGNAAATAMVTGADIWEINADESIAFQYSRHNYNVTDFWQPELPFATSDHNPEIVGIDVPDFTPTTYKEIQVLGTNDFHGRLLPDAGNAAGAAPFATAIKELEAANPNSIFVAAGDLVGASTFESFIQDDEPTIDALNAMGLAVSAAGNHEFDRGYEDFVGRIQDRADWEYIAANVEEPAGRDDLAETFTQTIDGVKIGFVGAVTEDLPALVNPAGIEGVTVTDIVDATNAAAASLKSGPEPADLVVLLVHEGAPTTECSSPSFTDEATTWGNVVQNASADVDAIISGHTHLAYNCRYAVADWVTDGRSVTKRPVVSAGQYGTNLNQIVFKFDDTGELAAVTQDVIGTAGVGYAPDPAVQTIVDAAVDYAAVAGAEVLGQMEGPFNRAQYLPSSGATENRGGESTLNNQVAEVQRWATDSAGIDTDIAFMNPGGLRADMVGTPNADLRDLSYRQAADVQPFANTLVNMELTGAQIETVLEQQWQRNAQGGVPSRPFLRLGVSQGFTYTYVETPETVSAPNSAPVNTFEGEVTGMWLDGVPLDPAETYSVTVNSFLGSGGDNFWELANGTGKVDSGKVDLEAMVDYMEQYDTANPLPVDYSQHAVEVTFPDGAPAVYQGGDHVIVDVASWAMSAPGDLTDTAIDVQLDGVSIGTAVVDNAVGTKPYDDYGTAHVDVTLPADVEDSTLTLELVGAITGTEVPVVVTTSDGLPDSTVSAADTSMVIGQPGSVDVTVSPSTANGTVSVRDGMTLLGSATLVGGSATVAIAANSLPVGEHELTLVYSGDTGTSPSEGTVTMTVTKAAATVTATPTPALIEPSQTSSIAVTVSATDVSPTGTVTASVGGAVVDTETLSGGAATLTVGPFYAAGDKTVTIDYLGDAQTATGSTTTVVTVTEPTPPPAVDTTTAATAAPMVYGTPGSVEVDVTSTNPTSGSVQLLDGPTVIGSGTAADDGSATLAIPGTALEVGTHALTVKYLGDSDTRPSQGTVQVTVSKAGSSSQAAVTPGEVVVRQGSATVQASVTAPGYTPTGSLQFLVDGVVVATESLSGGSAFTEIGPFSTVGPRSVSVAYLGDVHTTGSESSAGSVDVVKATPTMTVDKEKVRTQKGTTIKFDVTMAAPGQEVTGKVRVEREDDTWTDRLDNERATFKLGPFKKAGVYEFTITYLGSDLAKQVTRTVEVTVKKPRQGN